MPYDLTSPRDNARLYAKIAGSTGQQRVYIQYFGDIFALIANEDQVPLFSVRGIARSDWSPDEEGGFTRRNFDQGLFCRYGTGEIMDSYRNPFTGELNHPLHYRSGPLDARIGPLKRDGSPYILPWRRVGTQLSVTTSSFGARDAYLAPEKWPRASTGPRMHMNESTTHIADTRDLANPEVKSVVADHIWTFVAPFPPWMLMGQRPGYVLWRWVGRKIVDPAELDANLVGEIERRIPQFFGPGDPWIEPINGWLQYERERGSE